MKDGIKWAAAVWLVFSASASALTIQTQYASIKQSPDHGHLAWNGEVAEYVQVPADGEYTITVNAAAHLLGGVGAQMALRVNGVSRGTVMVNATTWTNYTFKTWIVAGVHQIGVAFLNDAHNATQDRNLLLNTITITSPAGKADSTKSTAGAWQSSMQTREQALVAGTGNSIAQHRKAPARVRVLDKNGNPLSGASVTVQQTKQDFLFGANLFGFDIYGSAQQNTAYKAKFAELFNYATLPFYWSYLEPVQGQTNYGTLDAMIAWCAANGIRTKGHAVLYADGFAVPTWLGGLPTETQQLQHVTDIFGRFPSINIWDLVNEPDMVPGISFGAAHAHARNLQPAANLVVNTYGHFYTAFDMPFANGNQRFYDFAAQQIAAGVPFDSIGMQAHAPLDTAFPLEVVLAHLDKFAALGKKIHITEFTPASNGAPVLGSPWRGTWTEAAQAAYAEAFYRVCFSHPAVEAISWWDFGDTGAWLPGGGMLRADLSAKPVFTALKNLIQNEWKTNAQGQTADGNYDFLGYHGGYTVTASYGSESKQVAAQVAKNSENIITITLNVGGAPADTTAPVITLIGASTMSVKRNRAFTDPGATAQDNRDGDITSRIVKTGTVNTGKIGTYYLRYNVSDSSGNAAAQVTRTVKVTL